MDTILTSSRSHQFYMQSFRCTCSFTTYVDLCDHHLSQGTDHRHSEKGSEPMAGEFHHLNDPMCYPFITHTYFLSPEPSFLISGNHQSFLHFHNFIISRILYKWNHTGCNLWDRLFSPSIHLIISWRFIKGLCSSIVWYFLYLYSILWYGCAQFVYSPIAGYLDYFKLLVIANKEAMNISVQVFVWTYVFISLEYIPKIATAGSYDCCMFSF